MTTCRVVTLPVRPVVNEIMPFLLYDLDAHRTEPSAVGAGDHSCGDYPQISLVQVHNMPALGTLVNAFPFLLVAFVHRLIGHVQLNQMTGRLPHSYWFTLPSGILIIEVTDVGILIANWEVGRILHFAPFTTAAQEQKKTPAQSQESSASHIGRRLWRVPSPLLLYHGPYRDSNASVCPNIEPFGALRSRAAVSHWDLLALSRSSLLLPTAVVAFHTRAERYNPIRAFRNGHRCAGHLVR